MMQLVFDFDGTLNNITSKYYHCYVDCIVELGGIPIDERSYMRLKQHKSPDSTLLQTSGVSNENESIYISRFFSRIETPHYLSYDHLFDFTIPVLSILKKQGYSLNICSARNDTERGMKQISEFGLLPFMSHIDIARHNPDARISKTIALKQMHIQSHPWVGIGDTEGDINCFNDASGISIAVLSGLRTRSTLIQYCIPTHIISDISKLPTLIDNISKYY